MLFSNKKKELTQEDLRKMQRKQQWQREHDAIIHDYEKNPTKYRLDWSQLPSGIIKGGAKWSYAALYRPPYNFRKCRSCKAYVTNLGWYTDLDGRERCKLCSALVIGPQWSKVNALKDIKRPFEGSHCVLFYPQKNNV